MDLILLRLLFVALLAGVCYFLHPMGLDGWVSAGAGAAAAGAVIVFEMRVRALTLRRLIGAVVGSVLGIFGAALFCLVLRSAPLDMANSAALQIFVLLLMTYVGLLVGASKGDLLNPAALGTVFSGEKPTRKSAKVLDTSVIIDGRIADIAEAGFIDSVDGQNSQSSRKPMILDRAITVCASDIQLYVNRTWSQLFTVQAITGMLSVIGAQSFRHHVKKIDQSRWKLPATLFDPALYSAHYREDMAHGD